MLGRAMEQFGDALGARLPAHRPSVTGDLSHHAQMIPREMIIVTTPQSRGKVA
jgi:hypothetical protein